VKANEEKNRPAKAYGTQAYELQQLDDATIGERVLQGFMHHNGESADGKNYPKKSKTSECPVSSSRRWCAAWETMHGVFASEAIPVVASVEPMTLFHPRGL
jgi:hypothetical protein